MNIQAVLAIVATLIVSQSALAQVEEKEYKNFYFGAGLRMANFSDSQYEGDHKPDSTLAGVSFGYQPLNFLALEVRDYVRISNNDNRMKWYAAAVSKWILPIDYHFNLFATAGYAAIRTNNDEKKLAPSFGIGMRFRNHTPLMLEVEGEYLHEDSIAPAGDDGTVAINIHVSYAF